MRTNTERAYLKFTSKVQSNFKISSKSVQNSKSSKCKKFKLQSQFHRLRERNLPALRPDGVRVPRGKWIHAKRDGAVWAEITRAKTAK